MWHKQPSALNYGLVFVLLVDTNTGGAVQTKYNINIQCSNVKSIEAGPLSIKYNFRMGTGYIREQLKMLELLPGHTNINIIIGVHGGPPPRSSLR